MSANLVRSARGIDGHSAFAVSGQRVYLLPSRQWFTANATPLDAVALDWGGTLAIALKLAQAKLLAALRGAEPVMLLDDIFGELDPDRRNALLGYLPEGAQKLITTTHLDWARGTAFESATVYRVANGTVK